MRLVCSRVLVRAAGHRAARSASRRAAATGAGPQSRRGAATAATARASSTPPDGLASPADGVLVVGVGAASAPALARALAELPPAARPSVICLESDWERAAPLLAAAVPAPTALAAGLAAAATQRRWEEGTGVGEPGDGSAEMGAQTAGTACIAFSFDPQPTALESGAGSIASVTPQPPLASADLVAWARRALAPALAVDATAEPMSGAEIVRNEELPRPPLGAFVTTAAATGAEVWLVDRPDWLTLQRFAAAHIIAGRAQRAQRYQLIQKMNQERLQTATDALPELAATPSGGGGAGGSGGGSGGGAREPTRLARLREFLVSVHDQQEATWTWERATFIVAQTMALANARRAERSSTVDRPSGGVSGGAAGARATRASAASNTSSGNEAALRTRGWTVVVVSRELLPLVHDVWRFQSPVDPITLSKLVATEEGQRVPWFARSAIAARAERRAKTGRALVWAGRVGFAAVLAAVVVIDASKGLLTGW